MAQYTLNDLENVGIQHYHPGEYLFDEIKERGLSIEQFAKLLGWEVRKLENLLLERQPLSNQDAEDIADALGTSAVVWMVLNNEFYEGKED